MKMHIEVVISTDETDDHLVPEEEWADEIRDLFDGWDVKIIKLEKVE